MSRATRRIVVAHLTEHGMNPAQIAAELHVSRDTVRRDLDATGEFSPVPETESAEPPAPCLLLTETTQLRQDLNLLAAAFRAQREDAACFGIHVAAEGIRRRTHARFAANERQEALS
jgi:AraC-like DNA-binding protein